MRVLVVGGGGREHAICAALVRDPSITALAATPGNPGIATIATLLPGDDPVASALGFAADLVVIGPEAPLVDGLADRMREAGLAVFGPSAAAARLEGSKAFAKEIMAAAGIPTAGHMVARGADEVRAALEKFGPPYVVKHDGLAAGKGVLVTEDIEAAIEHAADLDVVIEEFLDGPEVSLLCISDGVGVVPLIPAQDFKRIDDGEAGPNTGGMGAYAPLPWAPPDLVEQVVATVAQPAIDELSKRGTPFVGCLYCGLALTSRGLRVVEFNARFGDPETQAVLELLLTPLAGLLHSASIGNLADHPELRWRPGAAVTVVMSSAGYPISSHSGDAISGLDEASEHAAIRHAGTAHEGGVLVTAGGRVLSATAVAADLGSARSAAYRAIDAISFEGAHARRDIAQRAADGLVEVPSEVGV